MIIPLLLPLSHTEGVSLPVSYSLDVSVAALWQGLGLLAHHDAPDDKAELSIIFLFPWIKAYM